MAHALGCPNCGHPVARLLIVYEKKPTEPGWRSVDLMDKVSKVMPAKPTLVAAR